MLYSVGHGTIDTDHDPGWGQEEEWSQDCSMVQVWISGRSVWPWYWWLTLTSHVTITTVWSLNNRKYSMLMFISNGWGSIISSSEHLESKNQFLVVLSSFVKNYNQHKRGVTQLGAVISSVTGLNSAGNSFIESESFHFSASPCVAPFLHYTHYTPRYWSVQSDSLHLSNILFQPIYKATFKGSD